MSVIKTSAPWLWVAVEVIDMFPPQYPSQCRVGDEP